MPCTVNSSKIKTFMKLKKTCPSLAQQEGKTILFIYAYMYSTVLSKYKKKLTLKKINIM
jgi:hypothetical protein